MAKRMTPASVAPTARPILLPSLKPGAGVLDCPLALLVAAVVPKMVLPAAFVVRLVVEVGLEVEVGDV